jgi:hypothetical protein
VAAPERSDWHFARAVARVEPVEGPDDLVVHELSLLGPLRKALRTRHLKIEYASSF